ncbi:MAG TPA: ABC transporter ATP-binding protein [Stellaceae bacterium]|nr:ABC transporter ATP-binding protein [Stellaceae bacterium]
MDTFKYFRGIATRAKLCLAGSIGCLVLGKAANIAIPILYGLLTDWLTRGTSAVVEPILFVVLAYSGLRMASFTLANFRDLLFLPVAQNISREWLRVVIDHILGASEPGGLTGSNAISPKLIERGFKELEGFCRTILFSVLPTGLEIVIQTVVIGILFDWALGAIPLISSFAYIAVTIALARRRYPLIDKANRQDEMMVESLAESLDALEEIRLYRLETERSHRLGRLVGAYHTARRQSDRVLFAQFTLQGIILAVGYSMTVYLTTMRVLGHTLSMGGFVTVNIYLLQLFVPLSTVGQIYHEAVSSSAALGRVKATLARLRKPQWPARRPEPLATRPDIVVTELSYRYETGQQALREVSLAIPFGSRVGLVGRTGSGKSTLVRILCGLLSAPGDHVRIGGQPMSSIPENMLHETIVMVSQRPVLFHDTILGNLSLGNPDLDPDSIRDAARTCGIASWIAQLPEGYDTLVERGGGNLSGGQRQQLCIARALLRRPKILILDEATSNLDRVTEYALLDKLLAPGRGWTVIVISHRTDTLRNTDFLVVLEDGQITAAGAHAALLEQSALYRELLGAAGVEAALPIPLRLP